MAERKRPRLPTREEIRREALRLFMQRNPVAWEYGIVPEEDELREWSLWQEAKINLMLSVAKKAEEELEWADWEYKQYLEGLLWDLKAELELLKEEMAERKPPTRAEWERFELGLKEMFKRICEEVGAEYRPEDWEAFKRDYSDLIDLAFRAKRPEWVEPYMRDWLTKHALLEEEEVARIFAEFVKALEEEVGRRG